jgi:hypothetical protein
MPIAECNFDFHEVKVKQPLTATGRLLNLLFFRKYNSTILLSEI